MNPKQKRAATAVDAFLESFLPLFVAVNVIGTLPIFIGLTEGMTPSARRSLVVQAASTALGVSVLILFAGDVIFKTMGITLNDLRVGGGLILLVLSIVDLVFADFRRRDPTSDEMNNTEVGIVPLGIPLIIGPAAITTILISQARFGYLPTLVSLVVNLGLVVLVFSFGPALMARFGSGTSKAIAKVASLFLAAIAVAMIRAGIFGMIAS
ncbi:MAG TPA: MarC family protein, partial [Rhodothermales bacterium]|nr:MarC family protein [Rhodothermales bacterium]